MAEPKTNELMEKIVSLCKRRGFIFQSSEIYGGINGFWDYGPLGAELKRNVRDHWWRYMTQQREDVAGLDASIIMHPKIWEASGHTTTFSDPMVDCLLTKRRFRADQIEPMTGKVHHFKGAIASAELSQALQVIAPSHRQPVVDAAMEIRNSPGSEGLPRLQRYYQEFSLDGPNIPPAGVFLAMVATAEMRNVTYSVMDVQGNQPEAVRKKARQYYASLGLHEPVLYGETTEWMEKSTRFNSEDGPGKGGLLTEPRAFNLMFKTYVGPIETADNVAFLRPETAQAIFAQFQNVNACARQKVPFGICQIGKAFRNEINPRNYTFRSREFEQMEIEFFIRPDEVVHKVAGSVAAYAEGMDVATPQPTWGWELWHRHWVEERLKWYENIGLGRDTLELYWQEKKELAHYAKACVDIQYKFPFGTQELEGIAARGDFDLTQHQKCSGKSMEYFDEEAKQKYVPHVIEPSAGVDRLVLALICNAYREDQIPDEKGKLETRVVMRFHPRIAPVKVGVFPLLKNKPELVKKAKEVRDLLRPHMTVFYDEGGAIGRRYRRQDEAGTPFGVTIDFDTLGEKPELLDTVTLRDRDTCKQERVKIQELAPILVERIR